MAANRGKLPGGGEWNAAKYDLSWRWQRTSPDSLERLSPSDLTGVVRDLIGEVGRLRHQSKS
jgi:hypothetical protein